MLSGVGWPLLHRVIPNGATGRWCRNGELGPRLVRVVGRLSVPLARAVPLDTLGALAGLQRPGIPLFTPALHVAGMPDRAVNSTALHAGESVRRPQDIIPAARAVAQLTPADR